MAATPPPMVRPMPTPRFTLDPTCASIRTCPDGRGMVKRLRRPDRPAADAVGAGRIHGHVAGREADVLPLELPSHLQARARAVGAQRHDRSVDRRRIGRRIRRRIRRRGRDIRILPRLALDLDLGLGLGGGGGAGSWAWPSGLHKSCAAARTASDTDNEPRMRPMRGTVARRRAASKVTAIRRSSDYRTWTDVLLVDSGIPTAISTAPITR